MQYQLMDDKAGEILFSSHSGESSGGKKNAERQKASVLQTPNPIFKECIFTTS